MDSTSCSVTWLAAADVAWRPSLEAAPLNWRVLFDLKAHVHASDPIGLDYDSDPGAWDEANLRHDALLDALLLKTLSMHHGRKLSWFSQLASAMIRFGLPTFGHGWKIDLLSRARGWEFRQWLWRIQEKGLRHGVGYNEIISTLLDALPLPEGQTELPIDDFTRDALTTQDAMEGAFRESTLRDILLDRVAWHWQVLRGFRMSNREWRLFCSWRNSAGISPATKESI